MENLARDLRYAARQLWKNPGFVLTAVITLALGIGANTALFSLVKTVLLTPPPYPDPGRLVRVWSSMPERGLNQSSTSMPDYLAMREKNRSLEELGAYMQTTFNVTETPDPERVVAARVTASLLRVLNVAPAAGSEFTDAAERWGEHRMVLISEGFWRRRFGGSASAIGQTLLLDEEPFTIAGVLPASFRFPDPHIELWTPLSFPPGSDRTTRDNYYLDMVGRLRQDVTPAQAQTDLTAVVKAVNTTVGTVAMDLQQSQVGDIRSTLLLLMGGVMCVLLIACANVANLVLARGTGREKELNVRAALGAGRRRLIQQVCVENLMLSFIGGACGLLFAYGGIAFIKWWAPPTVPRIDLIRVDGGVLALTALMTALSAIGFSLGPALQLCADRAAAALKEYGRGSASRGRWARSVLVVVEVALSVILLTGAGLFIVSLMRLQQVDAGFNPEHVLTMRVDLPAQRPLERTTAFVEAALERIQALPGVVAAGATTALPLAEGSVGRLFTIDGQPAPRSFAEIPVIQYRQVTSDYMKTLRMMVRRGRPFAGQDDASHPRVAIVNETLANRFFGNNDPIGRRVYLGPHETLSGPAGRFPRLTIVGVIRDLRHRGLDAEVQPELFVPYEQREEVRVRGLIFTVRGASNVISGATVRDIIHDLEPSIPVSDVRTMEERLQVSLSGRRFTISLLGLFASVALVLAAVGIYGVVTYTVGRRLPEIGIRLALGARPSSVVGLMLRQSAALILSGVAIGVGGSLALTRFVQAFLFQVRATDPWIHLAIIVLLACVALTAAYVPARRAARIDPLVALRHE